MVALSTAIKANEARIQRSFVAVFVGGTAGIGSYALRSLAETHGHNGGDPRCYVVGRNAEAANALIATCKSACPSGNFRSISVADLSLIKNVDDCCKRIVAAEEQASGGVANFDVVLMTQGVLDFGDRKGERTLPGALFYVG